MVLLGTPNCRGTVYQMHFNMLQGPDSVFRVHHSENIFQAYHETLFGPVVAEKEREKGDMVQKNNTHLSVKSLN